MKTATERKENAQNEMKQELDLIEKTEHLYDFPQYKHSIRSGGKIIACFDADTDQDLADLLNALEPTNKETVLGFAGKEDQIIETPYRITADSNYHGIKTKIQYTCGDLQIWITASGDVLGDFSSLYSRKVTDSEHIYYLGMSIRQINEYSIMARDFGADYTVRYYGGHNVCTNPEAINEMMNNWKAGNGGILRK